MNSHKMNLNTVNSVHKVMPNSWLKIYERIRLIGITIIHETSRIRMKQCHKIRMSFGIKYEYFEVGALRKCMA